MRSSSTNPISLSLIASACFGCATGSLAAPPDDGSDGTDETTDQLAATAVTPLPSFTNTPNIRQAMGLLDLSALAVIETVSGFQIYRCDPGDTGPTWKLRTPLAAFVPALDVQHPLLNQARLDALAAGYHYRSDFGGLLTSSQVQTLGLASSSVVTAPVWDFTFQAGDAPLHHEVLAGRLLAADTTSPANIPLLLLEVRGRSIDPGTPTVIASTTHVLRWSTRGGLAPAASTCRAATLGQELQSPYSAEYFFLGAMPPPDFL